MVRAQCTADIAAPCRAHRWEHGIHTPFTLRYAGPMLAAAAMSGMRSDLAYSAADQPHGGGLKASGAKGGAGGPRRQAGAIAGAAKRGGRSSQPTGGMIRATSPDRPLADDLALLLR